MGVLSVSDLAGCCGGSTGGRGIGKGFDAAGATSFLNPFQVAAPISRVFTAKSDAQIAKEATSQAQVGYSSQQLSVQTETERYERIRTEQQELQAKVQSIRDHASAIEEKSREIRNLYTNTPGLSSGHAQALVGYEEALAAIMSDVVRLRPDDVFAATYELGNAEWALGAITKEVEAIRERATAEAGDLERFAREARITAEREAGLRAQDERRRRDEEERAAVEAGYAQRRAEAEARMRKLDDERRRRDEDTEAREREARAREEARYQTFLRSMGYAR